MGMGALYASIGAVHRRVVITGGHEPGRGSKQKIRKSEKQKSRKCSASLIFYGSAFP
jgi:hypothetical protein